ncbi:3-deoxy-7-phosphoheptulonate synthase [Treponema ruminis]|uniref:3-deoxy-7-phosphoheptulonate synthase n=1 Tax=Treponema ruminis TaxID=744515 RepID=A0A7W8G8P6_9SPIR|nr:3-deoxy-7-phosphoheptulonate synthase [Treponema ruminis]MBB5225900.1 3-deoxy-7-phosphoheptulonate synthase [Treponema ruminis]QSI03186.1 3-deoxy-7-phosphoheptulonate synthase [Treponema ruminis]
MVIVLKKDISTSEKENIKSLLAARSLKINELKGEESTVFAAVGKLAMDVREVEVLPGVEKVIPISKPYKMASREFKPENSIVEIPNNRGQIIRVGGSRLVAIAGPCAVESRQQMLDAAKAVSASGATMLRGGAYKPRTSPYSFQGLGEEGLKYLKEAGEKYGLPVVTEIVASEYIPVMKDYVDVYQVGARNMQNFELLKRLGALGKPVILKRGLSATIEEWLMSAEYLLSSGTDKVILCERGIRTYEKATRNTLDLSAIPVLRSMTHLPIIVDPSHALGVRDKIPPMALASIAAGADGIIVEVHCHPEQALSDAAQALYPAQFDKIMRDIESLAPVMGKEVAHIRSVDSQKKANAEKITHKKPICVFSGMKGAYAEQAIENFFEDSVEAQTVDSFDEIFQAVVDGKADYGMVPIENSTAGSVYNNYDNLTRYEDISIVGALTLRIQHSLLAVKGASLETIKNVYSHPQGLSQCSNFLKSQKWNAVDTVSTATAAALVAEKKSTENAAICNARNAKIYGLEVLKEGVQNEQNNYTRFVVIAANHIEEPVKQWGEQKPNMASFVFTTKNEAGALYDALGVFKNASLSMNRLESRPIAGKPWKYWFYCDVVIPSECENPVEMITAFSENLKKVAEDVRILGIYAE